MWIFFLLFDRAIFMEYKIAIYAAASGIKNDWKVYTCKNMGRKKFQIDLGLSLIEKGIRIDWKTKDGVFEELDKPCWMRKQSYIACNCKACFFCKEGKTTGIESVPKKYPPSGKKQQKKRKSMECSLQREKLGGSSGSYCRVCYWKRRSRHRNNESAKESKKHCNTSRLGCLVCKEQVCKDCWNSYDHNPAR